jgi:beta-xylosidase
VLFRSQDHFNTVRHGGGVWAPSIRYHNNQFYIYYPDPDFGIYVVTSKNIEGPWSAPVLVEAGKGLIDPCPLWDTDGKNYLVHAYAGSRAGIKSILVIKELDKTATKVISKPTLIYDGHEIDPTIEGPKFYKRGGWYYIFAPAGGVATGWQTVLRSKNIYGPYERRVVMEQGSTAVNGPHQGAWVETPTGESWFLVGFRPLAANLPRAIMQASWGKEAHGGPGALMPIRTGQLHGENGTWYVPNTCSVPDVFTRADKGVRGADDADTKFVTKA